MPAAPIVYERAEEQNDADSEQAVERYECINVLWAELGHRYLLLRKQYNALRWSAQAPITPSVKIQG
ncbi:MAG: hypothetical protein NDI90_02305 [Nitrospira sp. BO4]|jgi:hypothetical protein|nr:hypothetical protein [Nitrospira sp. BO4]